MPLLALFLVAAALFPLPLAADPLEPPTEWVDSAALQFESGLAGAKPLLTAEEREYLSTKEGLRYCFNPVWTPFDYLEEGEHRGIFKEYLELFAQKLGMPLLPVPSRSWEQTLEFAKARKCDLVSGAVTTPERREYLAFTSPYYNLNHVLVALVDKPFVGDIAQLAGKPITVPGSSAIVSTLAARYPSIELLDMSVPEEVKSGLDSGRAYAAVTTLEHGAEIVEQGRGRYRIIGTLNNRYPISVAVRSDDPRLLSIMDKLVASVTQAERDTIAKRWTTFTIEQSMDYSLVWWLLGVIAVVGVMGLFLLHRDYGLTRINRRLLQAKEAAEAADRVKDRFLANMSHEIRTPLNGILSLARLGLQSDDRQKMREYLRIIDSSGRSLLGIINEILDLSKIESGAARVETSAFDLHEIMERVVAITRPLGEPKGLEISYRVAPGLGRRWWGDARKLEQVLMNLAGNAVKFTEVGRVELEVDAAEGSAGGSVLDFCVRDSGIGMEPGQIEQLFTPFQQADTSTTRNYGGTGLGLAITKHLVELMGGDIAVRSGLGEGSEFRFTLPLEPIQSASAETSERRSAADESPPLLGPSRSCASGRVLVVDDNEVNRMVAGEFLELMGLESDAARQGQEALERLQAQPHAYALVLMDIQMPVMDGCAATRRIRQDERFGDLPILALTAHSLEGDQERCLAAGMNDFISKPIEQQQFMRTVCHWIEDGAAPEEPSRTPPRPAAESQPTVPATPKTVAGLRLCSFDVELGLKQVGGNETLYRSLLEAFYRHNRDKPARFNRETAAEHREEVRGLAHNLKNNAALLGAVQLQRHAQRLDAELRGDGLADPQSLAELQKTLSQVLDELAGAGIAGDDTDQ